MEQGYLIDTNCVIDYLDNKLPENSANIIEKNVFQISFIPRIELLSWPEANFEQTEILENFISASKVFLLEESVITTTIELRKKYRIKLPDAIIAATAILNDLILVTRNVGDFKNIENLKLFNPH